LAASAVLVNYWVDSAKVNNAVWITICMVVVFLINFLVSRYAKPPEMVGLVCRSKRLILIPCVL
jgi:hypothetical protein